MAKVLAPLCMTKVKSSAHPDAVKIPLEASGDSESSEAGSLVESSGSGKMEVESQSEQKSSKVTKDEVAAKSGEGDRGDQIPSTSELEPSISMENIQITKEFVQALKTFTPVDSAWHRALEVMRSATKQHCIDYLVYLGGLDPILNMLARNTDRETTIAVLDFLLKVANGRHIYQDRKAKNAVYAAAKSLVAHQFEPISNAASVLEGALLAASGNPVTVEVLKEPENSKSAELEPGLRPAPSPTPSLRYGSEACGRWAYVLTADVTFHQEAKDEEPSLWTFCRIENDNGSQHLIKTFDVPFEEHGAASGNERSARDGRITLTPSNIRFLTDKEGNDILRRGSAAGRAIRRRRIRPPPITPAATTPRAPRVVDTPPQPTPEPEEKKPKVRTFVRPKVLSPAKTSWSADLLPRNHESAASTPSPHPETVKEKLDGLNEAVVRMRIRQWQSAQVPLRRRRRSSARRPRPVVLHRNLHREPCINVLQVDEPGTGPDSNSNPRPRTTSPAVNSASAAQTLMMRQKMSRYPGVSWVRDESAWRASTTEGNEFVHLGYFDSEHEAWRAIYTLRESRSWPIAGPPPQPIQQGEVVPPENEPEKDQRTDYPGVQWSAERKMWFASTNYRGFTVGLGEFLTKEDGWRAICMKRRRLRWPAKSCQARGGKSSSAKDSRHDLRVDVKMANEGGSLKSTISNKKNTENAAEPQRKLGRPQSPSLGPGTRKYVSWNMFQKIHRGRQVTSKEWRQYNLDLARRAEDAKASGTGTPTPTTPGISSVLATPTSAQTPSSVLNMPLPMRKRFREIPKDEAKNTSDEARNSRSKRPRGEKDGKLIPPLSSTKATPAKDSHGRIHDVNRTDIDRRSEQKGISADEKSMSVEELYKAMGEYESHFLNPSSAVVWLMTANPTKFRRLLVPPRFRVPASYQGSGGYASAFERLQLTVTEADKGGSRWHRWYAAPHVKLENVQAALRRRWEDNAAKRQAQAAAAAAESNEREEEATVAEDKKKAEPRSVAEQPQESLPRPVKPLTRGDLKIETRMVAAASLGEHLSSTRRRTPRHIAAKNGVASPGSKRLRNNANAQEKSNKKRRGNAVRGRGRGRNGGRSPKASPKLDTNFMDQEKLETSDENRDYGKENEDRNNRLVHLQGQWLSSYEGVRTDPTVTGETVIFRNGSKFSLQPVRGRLTLDGIWGLDREVSTPECCVWRHMRKTRANPVVWTRKEMPARRAKNHPAAAAAIPEQSAEAKKPPILNIPDDDINASVPSQQIPLRNGVKDAAETLMNGWDNDDIHESGRISPELRELASSPRVEIAARALTTPPSSNGSMGSGDADVFAVARVLAGFQEKVDGSEGDSPGSAVLRPSMEEEEESNDGDARSEGYESDGKEDLVRSFMLDRLLTRARDDGEPHGDHKSRKTPLAPPPKTKRAYKCFGCGGRVVVTEGEETVECDACGCTSLSYRYRTYAKSVESLLETENQFDNSGKGFRGWNRHGHVEWVQD
uniref:Uncharacterized protein n=2 Tax=Lotharella globosa TaxID=91324 RepID=A0A6V3LVU8_9EUKA